MLKTIRAIDGAIKSHAFANLATMACGVAIVAEEEFEHGTLPYNIARITLKICVAIGVYTSGKKLSERK